MQPVMMKQPLPSGMESRMHFRRHRPETHEAERVHSRIVLARLESVVDRIDGVWNRYYLPERPLEEGDSTEPSRSEGTD